MVIEGIQLIIPEECFLKVDILGSNTIHGKADAKDVGSLKVMGLSKRKDITGSIW